MLNFNKYMKIFIIFGFLFLGYSGYKWITMQNSLLKLKNNALHQENISRLLNSEKKHESIKSSVVIGGCAKNVEKYLPQVMKNILDISDMFSKSKIIIYHDISRKDNTLLMLQDYVKASPSRFTLINHPYKVSRYRTLRLAYGRNKILDRIHNDYSDYEFFINIDLDDVSSGPMNQKHFKEVLKDSSKYDAVSFDRKNGYYDIWALRYKPFTVNPYDITKNKNQISSYVNHIRNDLSKRLNELKENEFFPVISAFNGFSIYKISKIKQCRYDGRNILFNDKSGIHKVEDCEHVSFHNCMVNNGDRVVISPQNIF